MNGLNFILNLYDMQYIQLAEILGINKQNITMWVKGKQKIPKKYLPTLEEIFNIDRAYFAKELSEIEKLEIQKEKLKQDLKPIISKKEQEFSIGEINDIIEKPIYDKEEMNTIEREIEKAKLAQRFKECMDIVDNNPHMDTYKLIVELMEKVPHEIVLHKTIEALSHYYKVIPDWVYSEPEQEDFEEEIIEVFASNEY
ncbi:helix-turn-helix domain-containing protein [Cetobacterium sp.]|uniref:helix-turn-helix domain-containing protein n=1 Tax=Cetobacterium sp. TaxID=2071632 RepID=UPI003F3A6D0C